MTDDIDETDIIALIHAAIDTHVAPILAMHRGHLLGDWAFIASTLGTAPGDAGSYVTAYSSGTAPHAQIGLAAILTGEVEG